MEDVTFLLLCEYYKLSHKKQTLGKLEFIVPITLVVLCSYYTAIQRYGCLFDFSFSGFQTVLS